MRRSTGADRRRGLAGLLALALAGLTASLTAGLLLAGPAAAGTGPGGQSISVSRTSGLNPAGESVTVSGRGFDPAVGIYVALCVNNGAGALATPCIGGVDMEGESGSSAWVSSNPPSYGVGLAKPFGDGGRFSVSLRVSAKDEFTSCLTVPRGCVVSTRADHTRSSDRSADVIVPVTFSDGSGGAGSTPGGQQGGSGGQGSGAGPAVPGSSGGSGTGGAGTGGAGGNGSGGSADPAAPGTGLAGQLAESNLAPTVPTDGAPGTSSEAQGGGAAPVAAADRAEYVVAAGTAGSLAGPVGWLALIGVLALVAAGLSGFLLGTRKATLRRAGAAGLAPAKDPAPTDHAPTDPTPKDPTPAKDLDPEDR